MSAQNFKRSIDFRPRCILQLMNRCLEAYKENCNKCVIFNLKNLQKTNVLFTEESTCAIVVINGPACWNMFVLKD